MKSAGLRPITFPVAICLMLNPLSAWPAPRAKQRLGIRADAFHMQALAMQPLAQQPPQDAAVAKRIKKAAHLSLSRRSFAAAFLSTSILSFFAHPASGQSVGRVRQPVPPAGAHLPETVEEKAFEKAVRNNLPREWKDILFFIRSAPHEDGAQLDEALRVSVDMSEQPMSPVLTGTIEYWYRYASDLKSPQGMPRSLPFLLRHDIYHLDHLCDMIRNRQAVWAEIQALFYPGQTQAPETTKWGSLVAKAMRAQHEWNAHTCTTAHTMGAQWEDNAHLLLGKDFSDHHIAFEDLLAILQQTPEGQSGRWPEKRLKKWLKQRVDNPDIPNRSGPTTLSERRDPASASAFGRSA
jgi:hypothetical protein